MTGNKNVAIIKDECYLSPLLCVTPEEALINLSIIRQLFSPEKGYEEVDANIQYINVDGQLRYQAWRHQLQYGYM